MCSRRTIRPVAELSRRSFLALGATIAVGACSSGERIDRPRVDEHSIDGPARRRPGRRRRRRRRARPRPPPASPPLPANPFTLGVSSGDPDDRSAVLWTRLTGDQLPDVVELTWELAGDASFGATTASGTIEAAVADGHSVHATVPLDGPAWFRFRVGDWTSPVGRAAPTPDGSAVELRLATASCQHWETGFYAAHRDIAEWSPDLVVFLGDFIYENAGRPVGDNRVRSHDGGEPTISPTYRGAVRPVQVGSRPAGRPRRVPVAGRLGRPRGREQLRRARAAGRRRRRGVRRPPGGAYRAWWEHMPVRLPPPGVARLPDLPLRAAGATSPTSRCSTPASTAATRPAATSP